MPDERYKVAFEAAMDDVAKAQGELVAKQKVANVMAGVYGVPPPFTDTDAPVAQSVMTMKPDQFANCSAPSEAARAYLKLRGPSLGAVDIDVIFDALKRGGFTFATSKGAQRDGLAKALGKDQQVRRLANDTYGLWEWYPKAKREKKTTDDDQDDGDDSAEAATESPTPPSTEPTEGASS